MSEKVLITPAELEPMLGKPDIVVIDTRSPDAYRRRAHSRGVQRARHLHLSRDVDAGGHERAQG